jgi:hypothetical protein
LLTAPKRLESTIAGHILSSPASSGATTQIVYRKLIAPAFCRTRPVRAFAASSVKCALSQRSLVWCLRGKQFLIVARKPVAPH